MDESVVVKTCRDKMEAQIIAGCLLSHGIRATVKVMKEKGMRDYMKYFNKVTILVNPRDQSRAIEVLKAYE